MGSQAGYRIRMVAGSPVELDPRLQEFFLYWRRARDDRPMPRRADIDPTEIPPRLLPFVMLTDVVDGGARFRFRLVGTGAVNAIGADVTGRHVDEINQSAAYRDYITGLYRRVVTERLPVFSVSQYLRSRDPLAPFHTTQRLMCPLSHDGAAVTIVFTCQIFALASQALEFPNLTADNPFVGLCEAILD